MKFEDYKKHKWFFTSSGKLAVGGKSAEQNDSLLNRIKKIKEDLIVMHTAEPGSPFSVILANISEVSKKDLEECAIFTGCFSRAWKLGKKATQIHIYKKSQIYKSKEMKIGTWGVLGKIEKKAVELKLALTRQERVLRAVPEKTIKNKEKVLLKILPGKINKQNLRSEIIKRFQVELDNNELLSAIPSGGFEITK